jgi:hypothetical protein
MDRKFSKRIDDQNESFNLDTESDEELYSESESETETNTELESDLEENDLEENDLEENDLEENDLEENAPEENDLEENDLEENAPEENEIEENTREENTREEEHNLEEHQDHQEDQVKSLNQSMNNNDEDVDFDVDVDKIETSEEKIELDTYDVKLQNLIEERSSNTVGNGNQITNESITLHVHNLESLNQETFLSDQLENGFKEKFQELMASEEKVKKKRGRKPNNLNLM